MSVLQWTGTARLCAPSAPEDSARRYLKQVHGHPDTLYSGSYAKEPPLTVLRTIVHLGTGVPSSEYMICQAVIETMPH